MQEKSDSSIGNLISLLSSSNDLARTRACKALIAMGSSAVPFLVEALRNSNQLMRWEAAKALAAIGDPKTAPALVEALEDEEFEVRWRAAEGLSKMEAAGIVPLLEALVKDGESVPLREGAHHVLHIVATGILRNELLPVLMALESMWPSVEVPVAALRALERLEVLQKTDKGPASGPFKRSPGTSWYESADFDAKRRNRRHARSL